MLFLVATIKYSASHIIMEFLHSLHKIELFQVLRRFVGVQESISLQKKWIKQNQKLTEALNWIHNASHYLEVSSYIPSYTHGG